MEKLRSLWRGIPENTRFWCEVTFAACIITALLLLAGCASEGQTAKQTGMVAAGGGVGALFSPVGAAIGAGVAYLFGEASSDGSGPVLALGFFARIGHFVDGVLLWAAIAYALLLLLSSKSRDNLLALFARGAPFTDRLKALWNGLIPSPHSPPAAQERKVKREAKRVARAG